MTGQRLYALYRAEQSTHGTRNIEAWEQLEPFERVVWNSLGTRLIEDPEQARDSRTG